MGKPGFPDGFSIPRSSESGEKLTVDRDLLPDTVDQRLDWAAAISQVILISGHSVEFNVFDPGSLFSHVTARIVGPETIRVPAGTFQAMRIMYQVRKPTGSETYQILTNVAGPRMLLKEEFPDGAVSELVKVQD